ncbi:helix-turn-helix domain-containing protein [Bosea sp. MMO-172]|uniref:helix-turn-helix domain-containing protein n=1 Tax=Bosea sp. MMO-172 TaxID=3127885 RepID=UPI0030188830
MSDFALLAAQIRAARALLGWSQSYLADGIRVSRSTIADLESAKRQPHESTLFVLMSELAAAGIEFTERGVSFREYPTKPYEPIGVRKGKSDTPSLG